MNTNIRIGIGYDLHRLVKGRELFLGGVNILFSKGLLGHSDADVLLHSVCDALLGACGLGDIGMYFPDTDAAFKDMPGAELVEKTLAIIENNKKSIRIINLDTVLICDRPNVSAYRQRIRESISALLDVNIDCVNVKAKTTENTSIDTISSYAAVLLDLKNRDTSCF